MSVLPLLWVVQLFFVQLCCEIVLIVDGLRGSCYSRVGVAWVRFMFFWRWYLVSFLGPYSSLRFLCAYWGGFVGCFRLLYEGRFVCIELLCFSGLSF